MSDVVQAARGAPGALSAGEGRDQLVLRVSQDAWQGDAQFTVSVNGEQVGGVFAASASRADGASDTFFFRGDWGSGPHEVEVAFLNDAWGGTDETDRNLHVENMVYHGLHVPGAATTLFSEGAASFAIPPDPPGLADADPAQLANWNAFNFFWDLEIGDLHGHPIKDVRMYLSDSKLFSAVVESYWSDPSHMGEHFLYTNASLITVSVEFMGDDDTFRDLDIPFWTGEHSPWTSYARDDAAGAEADYDNNGPHTFWIKWRDDQGLGVGVGPSYHPGVSGYGHWPY